MGKNKDQVNFELFCKELNLDYDFDSHGGGYYKNWHTNQAMAIYKYSDYRKRNKEVHRD